ncbi:MAG: penicillin-binding protein 2 [Ilumatobacter sp.]|nr:penicillin-binding protein 2 [Ilumatobacter sp.]
MAPKPSVVRQGLLRGVGASSLRLRVLLVFLLAVLFAVLVRVGQIQSAGGESLRAAGAEQWERTRPLPADRGTIFDRNGEELAMSVPAYSISVNPKLVVDEAGTARMLQSILELDDDETRRLYDTMVAKETGFVYVRREVDVAIGEQLAGLRLTGVNVDAEDKRILPGGDTGRSVIGRTDIDGVGTAGLELQYGGGEAAAELGYPDVLTGTPGQLTKEVAPRGRSIAGTEQITLAPVPGDDLVLTIDRSIQFATEQALVDRVGELGAKSGYVIVQDTASGDILAMASVQRDPDDDVVRISSANQAALSAYEPGSVAKVVTVAAALNEGTVTPESGFVVPWSRQYADDILKDSHQHPDEYLTVEQILVESSNIGTIDVQMSLGRGDYPMAPLTDAQWTTARETHWDYLRAFGFGEKTALEFPNESPGILKHWTDLWGSERVTVAYGQGFASTPIQMVSAVNAIANDGVYVAPRLVAATVGADGEITPAEAAATHEVVRPEVATTMQAMMHQVVCRGTAKRAQNGIEHFSIAGKTGTGLKSQPNGTYFNEAGELVYYASFVGFFPAEDPQVTVLVSIDEPPAGDINRFGGTAAAPVFNRLAPTIMHELGLQPPPGSAPCATS